MCTCLIKPSRRLTLFRRLATLVGYKNEDESVYAIRQEPFNLEWSSSNIKQSRLLVPGQGTPVVYWILGQLSWNGLLENDDLLFDFNNPDTTVGVTNGAGKRSRLLCFVLSR